MSSTTESKSALLVSNVRLSEVGGRAEKFRSHKRIFAEHGWDLDVVYVPEPDAKFPFHVANAFARARRVEPDAVIAVSNPFHLQYVGCALARAVDADYVAELRDPIYQNPDRVPGAPVTKLAKRTEHFTLSRADAVVWFDGIQIPDDYFEREYPRHAEKVTKLPPIGYDEPAFDVEPRSFDEWTITYAGAFYDGWIEPYALIDGVDEYADRAGDRDFRVRFYGDWCEEYSEAVADAGVDDIISTHGYVSHEEVVPIILGSDAVCYVGGSDPRNARNLSTKLFDYIGARAPILAIVDPSFRVSSFVKSHDIGVSVPEDAEMVADAIAHLRNGFSPPESWPRLTRQSSLREYLTVLNSVVDETQPAYITVT